MEELKNKCKLIPSIFILGENDGIVSCTCSVGERISYFSNDKAKINNRDVSHTDWEECLLKAVIANPQISLSKTIKIIYGSEPMQNLGVLGFTRNIKKIIKPYINLEAIICPTVITELPKKNDKLNIFIDNWMDIKNQDFEGNVDLNLYIGSTDEKERNKRSSSKEVLSINELSKICDGYINLIKGSKVALIFDLSGPSMDYKKICKLFNKDKFLITLLQTNHNVDNYSTDFLLEIIHGFMNEGFQVLIRKEV